MWMHNRGRVERNAGQTGDREVVNAAIGTTRRQELYRRVNDTAPNRSRHVHTPSLPLAGAEKGWGHDERAQQCGGHAKGQSGVEGMARGPVEVTAQGME